MAKISKPIEPKLSNVDTSILTEDDIAELELQAEKEVREEQIKTAKDAKLAEIKRAKQREAGTIEPWVDVTIDLAPYCDRILLDNVAFMQGLTYTVTTSQAAVMREVMQRTWTHQSEIDGKSENFYRKTRQDHVLPSGGVVNSRQSILRA